MARLPTPRLCRIIEVLLRYRRTCTPNVLTKPWLIKIAAYIPIILPGVGVKSDLTVAAVAMRPAQPKLMPVVTANYFEFSPSLFDSINPLPLINIPVQRS